MGNMEMQMKVRIKFDIAISVDSCLPYFDIKHHTLTSQKNKHVPWWQSPGERSFIYLYVKDHMTVVTSKISFYFKYTQAQKAVEDSSSQRRNLKLKATDLMCHTLKPCALFKETRSSSHIYTVFILNFVHSS